MMRPSLFHRSNPRHGPGSPRELARLRRRRPRSAAKPAARVSVVEAQQPEGASGRVRAAGGPVDLATYACSCGLLFSAPVSTTVACPHCGCEQAW
jgi:hypothetical protein